MPTYKTIGNFTKNNLVAGDYPIVTDSITIATGQNLTRGAVLGRIQTSGQYVLSDSSATDGSETPVAILAEDVDASLRDTESVAYLSGQFNAGTLVFGPGVTADSTKHPLRLLNIYLTNIH